MIGGVFMTRTISVSDANISIQSVIALTTEGDEVVLEQNGSPVAKVVAIQNPKILKNGSKKRTLGLGNGEGFFMSDDFNDELPDEFWGFDKDL